MRGAAAPDRLCGMSNFAFVQHVFPQFHNECELAESYMVTDPRAACFYSRRAVELLVKHLYQVLQIEQPYRDDLAARINHPPFENAVGERLTQVLDTIRQIANSAVHGSRAVPPNTGRRAVNALYGVMQSAGYKFSGHPEAVPLGVPFDPSHAHAKEAISREQLEAIATQLKEKDAAHAKALAERDDLAAAQEAELASLRAKIEELQEAAAPVNLAALEATEAQTRTDLIDLELTLAGWDPDAPRVREFPVTGMPTPSGKGAADYVLWGANGLPLAVIEAKRAGASAEAAQQQGQLYADCLEKQFGQRPLIFTSNGYEHTLWDDRAFGASGYPPRRIKGFIHADQLARLVDRRTTRKPLSAVPVDTDIAGRYYQKRAIAAIDESFMRRKRHALLVMATGTGKTRTVIALVEQLLKANWIHRALFLADRKALVKQAVTAFSKHLPDSTPVNLVEEKHADGRVYVSTYPTMMNLIDAREGERKFGPGFFDLVIIDEAHRSVYQKYGFLFEYFDALLVGLTATPKDEVDHNTYRLFHLEDGVPTDAYSLETAVKDSYLVPPRTISVGTKFLRTGIRYAELSDEEKEEWEALDWGDSGTPEGIDSEELNRFLFNADTVDKVIATLMRDGLKVAGGERLGKTIIFAKNQHHAEFIERRFNLAYPEYGGEFARVITHATKAPQNLIEGFSDSESAPHIAISVDMLDTGIDVHEVVNLVFFREVRSKTKFWQMMGRGTRLCPDLFGPGQSKEAFYVFDFCGNLEFFGENQPTSEGSLQKSLSQRLFETRVELLLALDKHKDDSDAATLRAHAADWLHAFVDGMNLDNVLVRNQRRSVETWRQREKWETLTHDDVPEVVDALAGLPTSFARGEETAKRFDLLVLRVQLALLSGGHQDAAREKEGIQTTAAALLSARAIPAVAAQIELIDAVAGEEWWVDVTVPMLESMRVRLRELARFVQRDKRAVLETDFEDTDTVAKEVAMPQVQVSVNWDRFHDKAEQYLRKHLNNVVVQRLRRNKPLTEQDLTALGDLLMEAAGDDPVEKDWVSERSGGFGTFVRSLVGLEREAVLEAFREYLDSSRFTVDQIRFITMVIDELADNGVMPPSRLFESPYTDYGRVDVIFPEEYTGIINILNAFTDGAQPQVRPSVA